MFRDLAIDLGTANTLVYARGEGIIYNEPSVIALDTKTGNVVEVGSEAWRMIGRTAGNIVAERPLRSGAITDFGVTQQMIQLMLRQIGIKRIRRTRALVCIPSVLSHVERQAVIEAAYQAGVSETCLIDQPLTAAIGSGLPVHLPQGNLVVDIGGGTSEAALVSMREIMHSKAVRVGSFDLDNDIIDYISKVRSFDIGERTAEDIKIIGGSAMELEEENMLVVQGRSKDSGMPETFKLEPSEIRQAMEPSLKSIISVIYDSLEAIKEDFADDLVNTGVYLAGGGSLLRGLSQRIQKQTKIRVNYVEEPLQCVIRGAGLLLESSNVRELFAKSPYLGHLPNYRQ